MSAVNPTSPFHPGEQRLQARAGVRDQAESIGQRFIRDHMPDQHRQFYQRLPFVLLGHVDDQGHPWASVLSAEPGFLHSPDPNTLQVNTLPVQGDPLARSLEMQPDQLAIGLLGLEPHSRRRNRLSGFVTGCNHTGFTLQIQQAFGNCPKYIQPRDTSLHASPGLPQVSTLSGLDSETQQLIEASDTCFVASSSLKQSRIDPADPRMGVDISHRGGAPGFVKVNNDGSLLIPDYRGNNHFNTLGNFELNPVAGMLFIDPANGDTLSLTGTVEIHWQHPELSGFEGAQRLWQFKPIAGRLIRQGAGIRFTDSDGPQG